MQKDWLFKIIVSKLTEKQADELLDLITDWINKNNATYNGGFSAAEDEENTEDE
jgi:prenyltransferase beta subunit